MVVSRPDSDNIPMPRKKGTIILRMQLTIVLKSVEYTMSWSKNALLIVIDTHKLHS